MAEVKVFWLGKGTLGDIESGEEIPKGYITEERFRAFEKKGLIGGKIVATVDNDSEKDLEIKDLKAQKETLNKKLSSAEKNFSKLEASFKKVSAEKDKLIKSIAGAKADAKVSDEKEVEAKPEKAKATSDKAGPV